jgi:polysaccharide biosynthesis transport protein
MNAPDTGKSLGDYQGLLRRRRHFLLTIIPAALLIAIFIAYVLPPKYRAAGVIMLEDPQLPQNVVATQVTQDDDNAERAAQTLELLRRKIMTKDSLIELVKETDPYPNMKSSPSQKASLLLDDNVIERVDPLTFQPLEQSKAFAIYYLNSDPNVAAAVDQKLVDLFVTYNQRSRAEASKEAYDFLQAQAKQLEQEMDQEETKLATFKSKYGDALPDAEARNLNGADRTRHDIDQLQEDILKAEQQQAQLEVQLRSISPSLEGAVGDWAKELAKARADLAEAEGKYTPEHPDVRRLKRAVADLVKQGSAEGAQGAAAPDNPEYLAVQSQLNGVRKQLASLTAQQGQARSQLGVFEKNLATSPNVEREYIQLSREHDNAQNSYADVQNKMKNAALAQSLETQARGEHFTLLRAPFPPSKPYFPNRLGIILLGAVLGCGIAFGIAAAVDASDPTLRGNADLQAIMNTSAIGSIPTLLNPRDVRRKRLVWGTALIGYGAASVFVALTVLAAH